MGTQVKITGTNVPDGGTTPATTLDPGGQRLVPLGVGAPPGSGDERHCCYAVCQGRELYGGLPRV